MISVAEALILAKENLKENNIDEREARLLLSLCLGISKEQTINIKEIDDEDNTRFIELVEKRCQGIPYAYLSGHKEFMGLDFEVNENVLIPREDTETLVLKAIKIAKENYNYPKVLDLCTGSGCIAISIFKNLECEMIGSDISQDALNVANQNATNNKANVRFIRSNLFSNINEKFDIIVSNPPYIRTDEIKFLQKEVKDNEPILALDGGKDGLDFYRNISKGAKDFLNNNGFLLFEIGFDEAKEVVEILKEEHYKSIEVVKDLSNNDRVIVAKNGG